MKPSASSLIAFILGAGVLSAQEPPPDIWGSSIGAGLAITSGNSDTTNLNFSFNTKYDPKTRFLFKADALYLRGEADGETLVDMSTANARGEYSLSDRTFLFGEVSYLRDPFKDIHYFIAPVAGGGYRGIRGDTRNLTIDAAVGAQIESNGLLDAGLTTTVATRLELKLAYTYDYKNKPPSPEIEKGDSALFAALLVKF
ncbi:MAG TPA: DUF481 domain-containing protein [Thermoanaerobaculia bacterium]|nr:DUF481 domain-containing protein [Thermoanaerobaculia bacterium]